MSTLRVEAVLATVMMASAATIYKDSDGRCINEVEKKAVRRIIIDVVPEPPDSPRTLVGRFDE